MNYIFDFDGTLMDTSAVILATIKATISDMGLPGKSDDECRAIIGIRTAEAGRNLYPDLNISNEEFARVFRANYERLRQDAHEQTFPGVTDTLARLRQAGHGMAIASSRRLSSLNGYLEGLGLRDWFDMVVGADSVVRGKPDPEPVLTILSALSWDPKSTMVVGDADVDIMMGRGAGCLTCAVTYGNGTIDALRHAGPDHMIADFRKIPDLL